MLLTPLPKKLSQSLPEVIRIEKLRELPIHVHHMHISLPPIPNNSLRVFPLGIPLNINPHPPINPQLQTNLIIHQAPPRIVASIRALQLQFL